MRHHDQVTLLCAVSNTFSNFATIKSSTLMQDSGLDRSLCVAVQTS
jgi:hypothetical protein